MSELETPTNATYERAAGALDGLAHTLEPTADGIPTLLMAPADAGAAFQPLRDRAGFESVTFVTAVDRYPEHAEGARFEVSVQLASLAHGDRLRLRMAVGEDDPRVPTCSLVWPGARFMERECFDMFGVRFDGHPDLRRLLMPEGYGHHPLRKEFPHQGIAPDRLYREWDEARRKEWRSES